MEALAAHDSEPQGRPPAPVLPGLWLFPPNRDSQGGSAWLLETETCDLLIDCPALTPAALGFLAERRRRPDGEAWIVLTGRSGHGRCRQLQQALGWPVLVQEQEAYLLPGVVDLRRFGEQLELSPSLRLLWTPGPSPGASVLHWAGGGGGLFCGRLLLPLAPGRLGPLRERRCFHWPRQLRSLAELPARLPPGSPQWIASGAALGALRGEKLVDGGAALLADLAARIRSGALDAVADPEPAAWPGAL
ncbi:MAG: MBL fold metallo-hydrolase [Synechococcaceae cyanobacterium]|nr:MBL fold metallo-hydrolase [Synechococcaceae cyanobacterium]